MAVPWPSGADRAIQKLTNSPVNHVGMAVVLDDLPPLMWHAELGRSLTRHVAGDHHRGVQLHDLRDGRPRLGTQYGQRAWLRQLSAAPTVPPRDGGRRCCERSPGWTARRSRRRPRLAGRWLRGRLPRTTPTRAAEGARTGRTRWRRAYCAEVVAVTYEAMGLLATGRQARWYDPGRFWSGDELDLPGAPRRRDRGVTLPDRDSSR